MGDDFQHSVGGTNEQVCSLHYPIILKHILLMVRIRIDLDIRLSQFWEIS